MTSTRTGGPTNTGGSATITGDAGTTTQPESAAALTQKPATSQIRRTKGGQGMDRSFLGIECRQGSIELHHPFVRCGGRSDSGDWPIA